MKAYSYLRFSTPEQAQGDSFRRQTALAEAYAHQHGLELDTELRFADRGVSAFRGKNAATGALNLFLRAVEDGDIDSDCYLLVESLDRISRNVATDAQTLFLRIVSQGVTLVTLGDGKVYSKAAIDANPLDLIMSLLVMIRAHEESLTKSKRLKQAWSAKRTKVEAEGALLTSKVPAWLQVIKDDSSPDGRIEVIEDRAAVVRRVFALTLQGQGKETISRMFNEEGIAPFGRAQQWHGSYVHKIQTNPAVVGTLTTRTVEHVDGKVHRQPHGTVPGYYPPVIDKETFARAQALKQTSGNTKAKGTAPLQNVLAGLAVCPLCGSRMTRVTKGRGAKAGKPYLVCSRAKGGAGCDYKAVRLDNVEIAVRASYDDIATSLSAYGSEGLADEIAKLDATAMALGDQIEELVDTLATVGRSAAITKRLRELETELEELQETIRGKRALLGTRSLAARLGDLQEALDGGTVASVNTALRELLASAVVDYQTGHLILRAHSGALVQVTYQWIE
ncbi:recombinase family protein [Burkholderia vietnamiensis]|uniref:recombinase family protein n=1 Tax=Burkholderia vietnamiensis TaxID=60552 RepID=UPI001B9CB7F1|nr:recombinase family protein [Burkholderia vietnamiensis]MBR8284666.1 recombinase family protein [Burkholderia vietnamiensis]